jgi:hypothetical protein
LKQIPLSKNYSTPVDDSDYARVIVGPKWQAKVKRRKDGSVRTVYAVRTVLRNGKQTMEYLHRFIMNLHDPKIQVDHFDHDGLNNRRSNLRIATSAENMRNQRLHPANTSGLKGVTWDKSRRKFVARIRVNGKNQNLGGFATAELAAARYDEASLKYHGVFGLGNAALGLLKKRPTSITVQLTLELQGIGARIGN